MAKVLFIHGGFGNALLQIAHVNKYETNFVISTFFTRKIIRKVFGFTNHPNFLKDRVDLKEAGALGVAMIPVIFVDLVIAKIFKHSLFTEFDIRFVKAKPVFKKLAYFGYFQANIDLDFLSQNEMGIIFGNDSSSKAVIESVDGVRAKRDTTLLGSGSIFQAMNCTVTMNLSTIFKLRGINMTLSAACASGSHSVGMGYILIRNGYQDMVMCGGAQEINPNAIP